MGICRDCFGRLSYTAIREDKRVFSVCKGDNRILEHRPYLTTDVCLDNYIWERIDRFDSFVQAVKFLKENLNSFL